MSRPSLASFSSPLLPTPREMVSAMGRAVVGQDRAKRELATAAYHHYVRGGAGGGGDGVALPARPDVVCLHGPSGCGKTELLKALSELLGVPVVIYDATRLSEVGYAGQDVDSVLRALAAAASWDSERASLGVILLDEIDKIRRDSTGGRDVSGEGVQRALLSLLSGATVEVRGSEKSQCLTIDTSRLLFVLAGAFVGLEEEVGRRLGGEVRSPVGFAGASSVPPGRSVDELRQLALPGDFEALGFIPEFVGRIGSFVAVEALGPDDLLEVLEGSQLSALKDQEAVFAAHGVELSFTRPALRSVVEVAMRRGTGARGLKSVVLDVTASVRFELPELAVRGIRRVVMTRGAVLRGEEPRVERGVVKDVARVSELRARSHPAALLAAAGVSAAEFSDPAGWSMQAVRDRLVRVRETLDWANTSGCAEKWWLDLERQNEQRLPLVLRLAEELAAREATVTEMFLAYFYSGTECMQANLVYLDFLRLKKKFEKSGKKVRGEM